MNKKTQEVVAGQPVTVSFPAAPTWWRILAAPAGATLQLKFDDGSIAQAVQGNLGRAEKPFDQIQVTSDVSGSVTIEWGVQGFVLNTPDQAFPVHDLVGSTPVNIASGETLEVPAEGYGTAILSVVVPASGSTIISDLYGSSIPYRYFDGRSEERLGTIPAGFEGHIILDLAGYSGFKLSYFGPGVLVCTYVVSRPVHPLVVNRQVLETDGVTMGGTPYAAPAKVFTNVFKNHANKSVTIRGKFQGGEAGSKIRVVIHPADLDGNIFAGESGYCEFALGGGNPEFFVRIGMDDLNAYFYHYGVDSGPFLAVPVLVGGSNYALSFTNDNGGGNAVAWGFESLEIISSRGGA